MTKEELKVILNNHKLWLGGKEEGVCADLEGANLEGANLSGADLEGANLSGADLDGTILPEGFKGTDQHTRFYGCNQPTTLYKSRA